MMLRKEADIVTVGLSCLKGCLNMITFWTSFKYVSLVTNYAMVKLACGHTQTAHAQMLSLVCLNPQHADENKTVHDIRLCTWLQ